MTYEGYADKESRKQYLKEYMRRSRLVDRVYAVFAKIKVPTIETYRAEQYAIVDAWLQKQEDAIVEEKRAIVHGPNRFDTAQLIKSAVVSMTQARSVAEVGKTIVDRDIAEAVKELISKVVDEAAPGTRLYMALHGNKDAEKMYLDELAKRVDHVDVEPKLELPSELQKRLDEGRSKIPSARELFDKMRLSGPDRELLEMRKGQEVTKMPDKYADMSDSEIREAKKRESVDKSKAKREQLLKAKDEARHISPGTFANCEVDFTQSLMNRPPYLTFEQAKKIAHDMMVAFDQGASKKEVLDLMHTEVNKILGFVPTESEKTFQQMLRKKRHWLDDAKGNAVEDSYVA